MMLVAIDITLMLKLLLILFLKVFLCHFALAHQWFLQRWWLIDKISRIAVIPVIIFPVIELGTKDHILQHTLRLCLIHHDIMNSGGGAALKVIYGGLELIVILNCIVPTGCPYWIVALIEVLLGFERICLFMIIVVLKLLNFGLLTIALTFLHVVMWLKNWKLFLVILHWSCTTLDHLRWTILRRIIFLLWLMIQRLILNTMIIIVLWNNQILGFESFV